MFLITSCATTVKFPVSELTPASDITAKIKKDKQDNYVITIKAKYLASPERLLPPKQIYVVWMDTRKNGINNIGQLKVKNAQKSSLETLTAFEPVEIFITAEDEGTISAPAGMEITRTYVKTKK